MKISSKKDLISAIHQNHFRVAIFGSARTKKGDKNYKMVHNFAKLLGEKEMNIVTGGGPGIMEAAHRGHTIGSEKNKAHSIGLVMNLRNESKQDFHIDIKKEFKYFSERLDHFIALSNAVVVAPGGIGTALELFYTWQLIQVGHIYNIPIILMGDMWSKLYGWAKKNLLKGKFINKEDLYPIFIAKNKEEALEIIAKEYELYKKGDKNFNLNLIRDKIKAEHFTHLKD